MKKRVIECHEALARLSAQPLRFPLLPVPVERLAEERGDDQGGVMIVSVGPKSTSVMSITTPIMAMASMARPAMISLLAQQQVLLLVHPEQQAVLRGGGDQQHGGERGGEQRAEVDVALELGDRLPALREGTVSGNAKSTWTPGS